MGGVWPVRLEERLVSHERLEAYEGRGHDGPGGWVRENAGKDNRLRSTSPSMPSEGR